MLVYGDASITESPNEKHARIVEAAREAVAMAVGVERHGALVAAFIEAGELAQGISDAAFAKQGHDASTPAQDRAMALLMELAGIVRLSCRAGSAASPRSRLRSSVNAKRRCAPRASA